MRAGSLFSGIGGIELALEPVGIKPVWFVESDKSASAVLRDHSPKIPNHGDITRINWQDVEPVELLVGGWPCQDLSYAGKGAGIVEGTRSGLWFKFADAIRSLRPRIVFLENSSAILTRGIDVVIGDLASMGYDTRWGCIRAADIGAPHGRLRWFCVATNSDDERSDGPGTCGRRWNEPTNRHLPVTDSDGEELQRWRVGRELDGTQGAKQGEGLQRQWAGDTAGDGDQAPSDTDSRGLDWIEELNRQETGWKHGQHWGHVDGCSVETDRCPGVDFGYTRDEWRKIERGIRRWESLTRPAPYCKDHKGRLNPRFVEWMQGFPDGWVTDIDIPRSQQLKCLGNAVPPQQYQAAFAVLVERHYLKQSDYDLASDA